MYERTKSVNVPKQKHTQITSTNFVQQSYNECAEQSIIPNMSYREAAKPYSQFAQPPLAFSLPSRIHRCRRASLRASPPQDTDVSCSGSSSAPAPSFFSSPSWTIQRQKLQPMIGTGMVF